MSLHGFYTEKGLALAAKLAAGAMLSVTKIGAGGGTTAASAAALAGSKQELSVGKARSAGQSAVLTATLKETKAAASYTLTELGVYASDPDEGEILYQVFRLDEPRTITAGGENTYRFYLKETVGGTGVTVVNSSAGELLEGDLDPYDDKVLTVEHATRSVTVAAADLAAYVAALPRLLAEDLEITVTGGSVSTPLRITGFYGGRLLIKAADGAAVTCTKGVWVSRCEAIIVLYALKVSGTPVYQTEFVRIDWSPRVFLYQLSVNGNGTEVGVRSDFMCMTHMSECSLVNLGIGVQSSDTAQIGLEKCTGSGNTKGIHTSYGGMVLLDGDTPALLGGSANAKGGPIFKGGALL